MTRSRHDPSYVLGFAVGLGLCTAALFGIPAVFWLSGQNHWLIAGAAFVIGAITGALLAPRIGPGPGSQTPEGDL